jgi:foldase protein PrsA
VVRVGGNSISKAAVDHWARIEAVVAYEVIPRQPVPNGVIPDPPNYTACIAFLAVFARATVEGQHKLTPARLRGECRRQHEELRKKVTGFLIIFQWMKGELADHGVKVTDGEVKHQLELFVHHEFSTEAEFHRYLTYTGMNVSDLSFILRDTLLGEKLQQIIAGTKKGLSTPQRQQAFIKFGMKYKKKWTARTSCQAGFVVKYCKQYKGGENAL